MATKQVTVLGLVDGEPVLHYCDVGEGETGAGYLETAYHNEDPPKEFIAKPEVDGHVYPTPK